MPEAPIILARPVSLDFEVKTPSLEKPTIERKDSSSSSNSTSSSVQEIKEAAKEAPKEAKIQALQLLKRKDSTSSSSRDEIQNSILLLTSKSFACSVN